MMDSSHEHAIRYLYEELTPAQFEQAVAELLPSRGYRDVQRIGGAGDRGVDITCVDPEGRSVAVQCKQYQPGSRVGSKDMQNFVGMITRFHRTDNGLFVTTGGYTSEAQVIADGARVEVIDGQRLGRMYSPLLTSTEVVPAQSAGAPSSAQTWRGILVYGVVCLVILFGLSRLLADEDDVAPDTTNAVSTATVTSFSRVVSSSPTAASASYDTGSSARITSTIYLQANVLGDRQSVGMLVLGTVVEITGPLVRDRTGVNWSPVTVKGTNVSGYVLASSLSLIATPVANVTALPSTRESASAVPSQSDT